LIRVYPLYRVRLLTDPCHPRSNLCLDHLGQLQQTGNCKNDQRYFEGPYFLKHQRCQEYEEYHIEHTAQMIVHQLAARAGVEFGCQTEGDEERQGKQFDVQCFRCSVFVVQCSLFGVPAS